MKTKMYLLITGIAAVAVVGLAYFCDMFAKVSYVGCLTGLGEIETPESLIER